MVTDLVAMFFEIIDVVANTENGNKAIDDLGSVIGRLYRNLVDEQGLPEDAAASICGSIGRSSGK